MFKSISILSVILLSASLAFAKPGKFDHHGDGIIHPKFFKELNLTSEQKDKVKSIKEASKDKVKELRKEMKEAGKNLKSLMASDASKEEISKAFELVQTKMREMSQLKFNQILEIREILTKEQKAKLKDAIDKKKSDRFKDDDEE